jgi:hypothetical protein
MTRILKHGATVAASLRSDAYRLLSPFNDKTPRGEARGYLTAILYLAPAEEAGGKTMCPHSTAACRAACLYTAGRGAFQKTKDARLRRTRFFLQDRANFLDALAGELSTMQHVADRAGLKLAIRLNGTSDVLWERETLDDGRSLFDIFDRATFYDFTRCPPQHRKVPENWRLTYSLADDHILHAVSHLQAGRSVAAVVPEHVKARAPDWFALGETTVHVVDGDVDDLRFLDPTPSLVLLKPKGALLNGGRFNGALLGDNPMVRERLLFDLTNMARSMK